MREYKFTKEAKDVIRYIKDVLVKEYPSTKITIEYFVLSVLENETSIAYQMLSRTMLSDSLNGIIDMLSKSLIHQQDNGLLPLVTQQESKFVDEYDTCIELLLKGKSQNYEINTGELLIHMININHDIDNIFRSFGLTNQELQGVLNDVLSDLNYEDNITKKQTQTLPKKQRQIQKVNDIGEAEKNCIDVNYYAMYGKVPEVYGNYEVYNDIFRIFSKRDKNNVVIVGDSGVGKTATVKHLGNMLVNNLVPKPFRGKKLIQLDFMQLIIGTMFKGGFEAKFKTIIDDSSKRNKYIFFVDDIETILSEKSKFGEVSIEGMLDLILSDKHIPFICTISEKGYSNYIQSNPVLKRRFQKIRLKEKTEEETIDILKQSKNLYEIYHNVYFDDDIISKSVSLCKRYITDKKLPDSVLDVFDEVGAKLSLNVKENSAIAKKKFQLEQIKVEKDIITESGGKFNHERFDELVKQEIAISSDIKKLEKDDVLNRNKTLVTEEHIREIISKHCDLNIEDITLNEKHKLSHLSDKIKSKIIGQDEIVDDICKAIKRQRLGISNPNKPCVFLSVGSTGVGKTYLAKKISEEVFGSEKNMVRLDMSEYSDKMSVNKLYGSSHGYVGYENGGILTEAVKKNKHCVLLLDEIEKANEEVFNVLLQVFDDGRLTDNKGTIVDFSNTIIIMTSNIGAKEAASGKRQIGFVQDDYSKRQKEIIDKEIRHKFKPEFINRIDKTLYFNQLGDDELKRIIQLEIQKTMDRLANSDYYLSNEFLEETVINKIFNLVKSDKEYGARPILRCIQNEIEDKLIEYVLSDEYNEETIIEPHMLGM